MSYNPYAPTTPWLYYVHHLIDLPKVKPNVGYWPRSRSTSGPTPSLWIPSHPTVYASVREAEENYAYHRHQQHMTDDFRAKPHFANRILVQRDVTLSDYYEWNANFPEMRGNW